MQWDDLRAFLALARAGRLAAAATGTGQNATTVARRVHRLEAALSATLFEQSAAGHVLTAAGHALLQRAEAIESLALDAEERVGGGGRALGGSIRLSASEGFGSRILAPRIPRFLAAHPTIHLDLIATSGFLNPSRREADIAIMLARPESGPLIVSRLTDYRLGLYASAAYLAGGAGPATVDALGDHRLVGYVPDQIYAPELRYLGEVDERLSATVRSSSINAQEEMIAGGAGVGILPCFIGDATPGLVRVLHDTVAIRRSFWLVVHRDVRALARIDRFVRWLQDEIAGLQPLLNGRAGDAGQ